MIEARDTAGLKMRMIMLIMRIMKMLEELEVTRSFRIFSGSHTWQEVCIQVCTPKEDVPIDTPLSKRFDIEYLARK